MSCSRGPDAAERYVSGTMAEPERMGFEDHYFSCESCLRNVQALQDAQLRLQADLHVSAPVRRRGLAVPTAWLAIAATIVVGVVIWRVPRTDSNATQPSPPVAAAPQATPAAQSPAPERPVSPAPAPSAGAPEPDLLTRLAAMKPPQYVALTTRSDVDADAAAFEAAMKQYGAGRFAAAARDLGTIAGRTPDLAHVQFFLGISELMVGRTKQGMTALQRSADTGSAPYADEAHFYLAKAALREKDVVMAKAELEAAVAREAGPEGEAARLLAQLRKLSR